METLAIKKVSIVLLSKFKNGSKRQNSTRQLKAIYAIRI